MSIERKEENPPVIEEKVIRNHGKKENSNKSTPSILKRVGIKRALLLVMLTTAFINGIYNQNYLFTLIYLGFMVVGLIVDDSLLLSLIIGTGAFLIMSSCQSDTIVILTYLGIFVVIFAQVVYLIIKVYRARKKKIWAKHFTKISIVYVLMILLFRSASTIQSSGVAAVVRIMEPILLRQVPPSSSSFRYHEYLFGRFACQYVRVIYDESDQIILSRFERSDEWKKVSGWDRDEAEGICISPAERIYSHFFIDYAYCK